MRPRQTITITKSGFVPMNLTIKTGDTISFTNTDVAAHEVLFKATTGFTCTAKPLVIQPTKTQSCTWTVAGSYPYSDPNQRDRSFRGTVTVDPVTPAVVPTVSLGTSTNVVKYGNERHALRQDRAHHCRNHGRHPRQGDR